MPSAAVMQALAAHMPSACAVGSPMARNTLYLPRLCSIPETEAELCCSAAAGGDDVACAAAAATSINGNKQEPSLLTSLSAALSAQLQASESSSRAEHEHCVACSSEHATCSSQHSPCSCCSSQDAACSTPKHIPTSAADGSAGELLLPAVVASTWADSIRHFTDCVPITADSVCSTSTGQARSARCSAESGMATQPAATASSSQQRQQQQQKGQAYCQAAAASSTPRSSSSHSSALPAAEDDGGLNYSPPLAGSLSLGEMDALEWQPWDRVAKWLELHSEAEAEAAAGGSAAVPAKDQPSSSDRSGRDVAAGGESLEPAQAAAVSQSEQQQQQQQGVEQEEPLFDAPDWWQESVKARLEEQREAFQSSWWCRLKISLGLAAQRATA